MSVEERSSRILSDRKVAKARLARCTQSKSNASSKEAEKPEEPAAEDRPNPLKSFASRFARHPVQPTASAAAPPVDPLQALAAQWQQSPGKMTVGQLEKDPQLAQAQLQLVYDTEITTLQVCGEPTGDDDLLLKIAQAPNHVEEE